MSDAPERPDPTLVDALRADFAARAVDAELDDETRDAVWRAVAGAASADERAALLARARSEPAVAEAWRVALALQDAVSVEEHAPPVVVPGPPSWFRRPAVFGALVAVAVAAVALLVLRAGPAPDDPPPMRADASELRSAVDADAPLPRDAAVLAWAGAAEGSRFSVTVTTAELAPVASVGGLADPRWTVPADALAPLPGGAVLLWRVESRAPDGTRSSSATFQAVLE